MSATQLEAKVALAGVWYALISPKGILYKADYGEHDHTAELFGFRSAYAAMQDGWVYMSESVSNHILYETITQAQIDTLFDWACANGVKMPEINEGKRA